MVKRMSLLSEKNPEDEWHFYRRAKERGLTIAVLDSWFHSAPKHQAHAGIANRMCRGPQEIVMPEAASANPDQKQLLVFWET
jgi:hypothetical protein